MAIIIEKDRHMRIHKPFFQAQKEYNKWFLTQSFNSIQNTFISLGDLFHTPTPTPEELDEMIWFFDQSKFKAIYLLAGNHDWSEVLKTHSILPLKNNPRIHLITSPETIVIENHKMVFLPFIETTHKTREVYKEIKEEWKDCEYVFYHFEDESIQFSKKKTGIDLSSIQGKRIGGHIHLSQMNYELSMPVLSRYDERSEKNNLLCIDGSCETYVDVPKYLGYATVNYPNNLPNVDSKYTLWDVYESTNEKATRKFYKEKYPDIIIREIHKKVEKEENIKNDNIALTLDEHFENYIVKRKDLPQWCIDRLKTIVRST